MKKKKLALFDVDGTLIDRNIAYELLDELYKKGLFDPAKRDVILKNRKLQNEGKMTKAHSASEFYRLFSEGLKGKKEKEIDAVADKVAQETLGKYGYKNVPEGMSMLSKREIEPVLLSNAPGVVVRALARNISGKARHKNKAFKMEGFGPEMEVKEGVYTGKIATYKIEKTPGLDVYTGEHLKGKELPQMFTRSGKYLFAKNVIEPKLGGKWSLGWGTQRVICGCS